MKDDKARDDNHGIERGSSFFQESGLPPVTSGETLEQSGIPEPGFLIP